MNKTKKNNRKVALAFALIIFVLYILVIVSAIWGTPEMTVTLFSLNTVIVVIIFFFAKHLKKPWLDEENSTIQNAKK